MTLTASKCSNDSLLFPISSEYIRIWMMPIHRWITRSHFSEVLTRITSDSLWSLSSCRLYSSKKLVVSGTVFGLKTFDKQVVTLVLSCLMQMLCTVHSVHEVIPKGMHYWCAKHVDTTNLVGESRILTSFKIALIQCFAFFRIFKFYWTPARKRFQ